MKDLQRRVAEIGHVLQERASDLAHASRITNPQDMAHALALAVVGIEDAKALLMNEQREAERQIGDVAPWDEPISSHK